MGTARMTLRDRVPGRSTLSASSVRAVAMFLAWHVRCGFRRTANLNPGEPHRTLVISASQFCRALLFTWWTSVAAPSLAWMLPTSLDLAASSLTSVPCRPVKLPVHTNKVHAAQAQPKGYLKVSEHWTCLACAPQGQVFCTRTLQVVGHWPHFSSQLCPHASSFPQV